MKSFKKTLLATAMLILFASTSFSANQMNANPSMMDQGVLATIATIDKNEILLAVVALNKGVTQNVANFAKMMITQHGSNLTYVLKMANQSKMTMLTSALATKLQAAGEKGMLMLGGLQGKQFDMAYINAMVNGHQDALNLINQQLMKEAKSKETQMFLENTKKTVENHLAAAKKVQQELKS